MIKKLAVIILAAGKGERMKSSLAKVLHPLCGRPLLGYVLDLLKELKPARSAVVLGYQSVEVRKIIPAGIKVVTQKKPLGTADALKRALPALKGFQGTVLVLYGDTPLLKPETIRRLIERHNESSAAATLLTVNTENPSGYGRILRDKYSTICGIVEDKDADDYEKTIQEINSGIICFSKEALLRTLPLIKSANAKREYYLTDAVGLLYKNGGQIESISTKDIPEVMGINSRLELSLANRLMQKRINEGLMKRGISIVDPDSTLISFGTKIGRDSVIYPFTVIERYVKIGKSCSVGPFAHLRGGTRIGDNTVVGNFTEIVRSRISPETLVKHFSYLGDSIIGKRVNIGAGTVTANFDGSQKHLTVVKDKAFIGSDTVLVAPVKVGRGAKTGAGAVVPAHRNVADNTVVAGVPARRLRGNG